MRKMKYKLTSDASWLDEKKSHLGSNTQYIKLRVGGGTQGNGAEINWQPMGDQTRGDLHAAVCEGTHA